MSLEGAQAKFDHSGSRQSYAGPAVPWATGQDDWAAGFSQAKRSGAGRQPDSVSLRLCVSFSLSLCVSASLPLRLCVSASLRLCLSASICLYQSLRLSVSPPSPASASVSAFSLSAYLRI